MKQREILFVIASIFVLVFLWVGLSIYHKSVASTITPLQNVQIAPIDPTFNTAALDKLKKRTVVLPLYQSQILVSSQSSVLSPSPQITALPQASSSAKQATGSAQKKQ